MKYKYFSGSFNFTEYNYIYIQSQTELNFSLKINTIYSTEFPWQSVTRNTNPFFNV